MKLTIAFFVLAFLTQIFPTYSQEQKSNERFYFKAAPAVAFQEFNVQAGTIIRAKRTNAFLKFYVLDNTPVTIGGVDYIQVRFYDISEEDASMKVWDATNSNQVALKGNSFYINSADNGKIFLVEANKIVVENESVQKVYRRFTKQPVIYGANLTAPFKLRPKIGEKNYTFSPEVNVGGYVGLSIRLSRTEPIFLNAPVVGLGFSSININDESHAEGEGVKQNGMAWGLTSSYGVVFQLYDFQIGFLLGHDFVSGDIGKNWIYNQMPWYSFSIGFSFLGGGKAKERQAEREIQKEVESIRQIDAKMGNRAKPFEPKDANFRAN